MPYTQENRLIAIETPLGTDVLLLAGFSGAEGISGLFNFQLSLISENHKISFEDIIGKNVTLSIILADGDKRYFNGIISRFSQGRGGDETGGDPRFSHYWATMVPWLWLLTMTADSRIFQKLSVPDIVEQIFKEKGFSDFTMKLSGSYAEKEYCVQYRETDFNFISRLLEDEGIYYYFEHESGKHTMIIADAPQENKPCQKQKTARYQLSAGGWMEDDVITSLEIMKEIRPAKYSLSDYNFEIPNTGLEVNVPSKVKLGPGEREIYDYPGCYAKKTEGDRIAKIRIEEEEAKITKIKGSSNCRAFSTGYRFTLTDFYRDDMNDKEYVLISMQHEANQGLDNDSELAYDNQFTCIPFEVPYRPPQISQKPAVYGNQTAIVVGSSGEEIYTDEHGRVKVQFHWDREGKKDENSSCWIRVSQLWAGAGWGAIYIPRIGHEVIIDFLEGDPDNPIITGRVYHGTNTPPYGLPDEKTKSVIKSNTSKGGGSANELLMEDNQGKTQVVLSNAYGHKITEDEETQTLTIETRDQNLVRLDDKNKNITVQTTNNHQMLFDDENKKIVLKSTDGYTIELDDENKKMVLFSKNGQKFEFDDEENRKITLVTEDGNSFVIDDNEEKLSVVSKGGHSFTLDDSGDSVTLEDSQGNIVKLDTGGGKIIIDTGSGSIDITAASGKISLSAMDIEIAASNSLKVSGGASGEFDGGAQTSVKGVTTSVEGSAMTEVKGGLVKIN